MRLFIQEVKVERTLSKFLPEEISSVVYHNIFDYPLTFSELIKWRMGENVKIKGKYFMKISNGFYYLEGREGIVFKRLLRKKISAKKIRTARSVAKLLSKIPWVKMVGLTGALAMENVSDESDIDLMVVTEKGSLWLTRLVTYLVLRMTNYAVRRPNDRNQKDKICLNLWLDEGALSWRKKDRNVYTAHEIAQVVPLVNKDRTYERFIAQNLWIKEYWPNAVKTKNYELRIMNYEKNNPKSYILNLISWLVEPLAFWVQYQYMKSKMTSETVTPTRALFHPMNWSKLILQRLGP